MAPALSPQSACPAIAHTDSDLVVHTRIVSADANPSFDQEFIVEPIINARAFVVFKVLCSKPAPAEHPLVATAELSLVSLADQQVHELWLPLSAGSRAPPGRLHVKLLFSYSEIAKKDKERLRLEQQIGMQRLKLKKVAQSMRATYGGRQ